MAEGFAWLQKGQLIWTPDDEWRQLGCRELALSRESVDDIEVVPLSTLSSGVVFRTVESEVWLWIEERSDVLTRTL